MSEVKKTTAQAGTQGNVLENSIFSEIGRSKPNVVEQEQEPRKAAIDNKNNVLENTILADVEDIRNNDKEKNEKPEIETTITNPSLSGDSSVGLNSNKSENTNNNSLEKDEEAVRETIITNPSLSGDGSVGLNSNKKDYKQKEPETKAININQLSSTDGQKSNKPDRSLERFILKDIGRPMPFPENTNDDVVVDDKKSAPYDINKRLIDSYGVGNLDNRNGVLYANYGDGNLHRVTDYNGNYVLKDGSVIDKDGKNVVVDNDQRALSNRFRDGIFEWMDTYGADSLTPDKLRTIMHEEGRDGWRAYRKTNNNMGNIAFAGEMLRELKKEYFSSNPKRAAAANDIDVNYMDGTVTTSLKDKDGNALSVNAIKE